MAKGEAEPLMSPAEMKPLLMLSKKQPVNCAIGMTRDKMGVILLDKKAKPRKMLALMKKKAAGAKLELDMASCRFGSAVVDTEQDSQLVQFIVNKEVSGALRPKLLEQLKKAGFGKCEIRVDDGLDAAPDEADEDEAGDDAGDDAGDTPAPPDAAATPAPGASDGSDAPAASDATDASGDVDAAGLTKRLTGLVKRMMGIMGSNPAGADAMKTAAMASQTAIKAGDLAGAAASADTLERLLDAAPPVAAGPDSGASKNGHGSPVFAKARVTWSATRKKVESELEKLHDELQKAYQGHGVVADLEKTFRSKVEPMMSQFDETLSEKLDEVMANGDPGGHDKLVSEARQIITRYEGFLASDPLIAKLDDNPFVPLTIEKTLTASLAALAKVIS